jgi:hypothetical protein
MILFYAKAKTTDPGVYGWGIVLWCDGQEINFRPTPPSDYLKMNPMWDEEVDEIINTFRGRMPMATMFEDKTNSLEHLRKKISQHVYGKPLSP